MVLGGGGVVTYAVASPSGDPGAAGRAKRPVKVYDLALKGSTGDRRELPRTDTEQFSLVGVSWTGAVKRLDGTAQVRTRALESGEWSAWQDLRSEHRPSGGPGCAARPSRPANGQLRSVADQVPEIACSVPCTAQPATHEGDRGRARRARALRGAGF
ncbi:hypothetical protein [Streptomyces cupreus]|uniref:hypothetical protein n=1 Tax=Streptomyces cupreus TaxID=2759956 RepID=UPI0021B1F68B|nr:hypothetical protein [Streptomyces cupreus]